MILIVPKKREAIFKTGLFFIRAPKNAALNWDPKYRCPKKFPKILKI
jgi:hypothetical protein